MAIGGTQWSLGGDVSNYLRNPAGLGFFFGILKLSNYFREVRTGALKQVSRTNRKYNTQISSTAQNLSFVLSSKKDRFK